MTKQEYERVRQEIAKKYKAEIANLTMENQRLSEMFLEERKQRDRAERELKIYKNKLNTIPESLRCLVEINQRLF